MGTEGRLDRQMKKTLEKIETLVKKLTDPNLGVNIQTVKYFLHTWPNVCLGSDIVSWLMKELNIHSRGEALGVAQTFAKYGYVFVAGDSRLTVKDDMTLHRFQHPYFWPTRELPVSNTDYAVHLHKRMLANKSRLSLEVYEVEAYAKFQRQLSHEWEYIWQKTEASLKVDKKRSKSEQYIIESQERAFWNLHRPPPMCDNVLATDPLKFDEPKVIPTIPNKEMPFANLPMSNSSDALNEAAKRGDNSGSPIKRTEAPKAIDSMISQCKQFSRFDPMLPPVENTSPSSWSSAENSPNTDTSRRKPLAVGQVEKWSLSLDQLLKDPEGVLVFLKHLEHEHSSENLRFWLACEEYKACPIKKLKEKADIIYREYLSRNAFYQVNLDSHLVEAVKSSMTNLNHFTFDSAQAEIFRLMKSDSYPRFLKSDNYKKILDEVGCGKGIDKRVGVLSVLTSPQHKT